MKTELDLLGKTTISPQEYAEVKRNGFVGTILFFFGWFAILAIIIAIGIMIGYLLFSGLA